MSDSGSTETPRPSLRTRLRPYRNYLLLAGTVFCLGGAFGVQIPLFANFIHEKFQIRTHEYGYLEALRETPGFLTVLISGSVMLVAAPRLGMLSLFVMGIGIAAYAWIVPIAGLLGGSPILALIVTSVFWSIGFHTWTPLQQALGLRYAPTEEKGRWLGWLRTTSGIGNLVMMGVALLLIRFLDYEGMFLFAGGLLILGAILIGFGQNIAPKSEDGRRERRILLKCRYSVYYLLTLLSGARKQIFLMFAVWLLVKGHGAQRETILILMIINQVMNLVASPVMGHLVDRFGERLMLSLSYVALSAVFVGYAFVENLHALYVLYIIDHLLFVGGIALTTYLNKIAPPEELRPTLTMGVTMNHVPSVLVPLIGGLIWMRFGSTAVFLGGAAFALLSLIVAQWVRPEEQAVPGMPEPEPAAD